jgi:hypothetical protein
MTERLPFEQLWRPILTQFRRHRVARTVGLLVGVLPVVGFSLYYLNRGSSANAPIFDVIRALYWPGLPAEIVLNWTGWYEVPVWEAHMSSTETIMRWASSASSTSSYACALRWERPRPSIRRGRSTEAVAESQITKLQFCRVSLDGRAMRGVVGFQFRLSFIDDTATWLLRRRY